ncbi:FMN-binding protein [Mycetocola miduiensis]|uniref:Uncharacterized protein, contains FMN-binding domain n=1 Tax=Mycetocola miduiensis TaxID=995034 RepID=A0A1I4ZW20_9MICO|nr:FMN-binding protein [Mycetocola miduiensis]SFN54411.1 Uncharacterized protein, contains FMN-binding domain [Mycetocola miduiensis]
MRTRALLGGIFASAVVLVVGWQVGTITTSPPVASVAGTATTPDTGRSDPATTAPVAPQTATDGTFVGPAVSTPFGTMQVQVTVVNGTITDVTALQATDHDRRSVAISNRAVPVLRSEVLAAQSASVATVGGATYTSDGYLRSLQSALDAAGF